MLKAVRSLPLSFGKAKKPQSAGPAPAVDILARLSKAPAPKPRGAEEKGVARDDRKAHRFTPLRTAVALTATDGKKLPGRIINVSSLAVAIEADFRRIDASLIRLVGQEQVFAVRRVTLGYVFAFEKPLRPERCRADLVL